MTSGCARVQMKKPAQYLITESVFPMVFRQPMIVHRGGDEKIIYISDDGKNICDFDIISCVTDTLVTNSPQKIVDYYYSEQDSSLYCMLWNWTIVNNKNSIILECPLCDNKGVECQWDCYRNYKPFVIEGNFIYTGLQPSKKFSDPNYDILPFYKSCLNIGIWGKDSDYVCFIKAIGKKPSDQPDLFVDDCYQTAFNYRDSIIVAGTELSENVIFVGFDGRLIAEKKLSSFLYKKIEKYSFEKNHSANKKIQYWKKNFLFRGIYYDKYRDLYYRVLVLPEKIDEKSFIRHKQDWVLIVADNKLSKKYEVYFDGDHYKPTLLIGKKGVYIETDEKTDLFYFD